MKSLFKAAMTAATLMCASVAFADIDYGLEVGVRQQAGEVDNSGYSAKSQMGLQFGGFAHFPLSGALHLRTGMLYTQRPMKVEDDTNGSEDTVRLNYLDVPVALMYKFEEYAGIYAGLSLGLNIDSSGDVGGSKVKGVKSTVTPLIFGAFFKFAPQFGANIYFESASGDVADGLKNYRAVGANLAITFD